MDVVNDKSKITMIYPLINNSSYDVNEILNFKAKKEKIQCLYVSSQFNLKGGGEIISLFDKIHRNNIKSHLIIVTPISDLSKNQLDSINSNPSITLLDYNLNESELNTLYLNTHILLNPTRMESFGMVVLESMKQGCAVISSDLFAVDEMVKNGVSGYLLEPMIRFYTKAKEPNLDVWNNRKNTIYAGYTDYQIVEEMYQKIVKLESDSDRKLLEKLNINSYLIANQGAFDSEKIIKQWEELFSEIQTKE